MIERTLEHIAFDPVWGRQMRFIAGPRQSGKTTLAKKKLQLEGAKNLYYLWDLRSVRDRYKQHELFFTQDAPPMKGRKAWVCFDEIHKVKGWKNIMKGIFDQTQDHYQFIITGSSKLNILKKAGDSLSGRYFTFHLFPLMLNEAAGRPVIGADECQDALDFILAGMDGRRNAQSALEGLLRYSGFPEPFLAQGTAFHKKWSTEYLDRVITEDIGALTHIADREKLYDLYRLLPEFVGSPLSENSVAGHLESNPVVIKNYLRKLEDFYLAFKVPPYSKNIKRAIIKASKWYLFDWTAVNDPYKRFENFAAVQLYARLSAWQDLSGHEFALSYVRDKEKHETDFLVLKDRKPWLLIEVKYSDSSVDRHHKAIARVLGGVPVIQICHQDGVACQDGKNVFRLSASRFLG